QFLCGNCLFNFQSLSTGLNNDNSLNQEEYLTMNRVRLSSISSVFTVSKRYHLPHPSYAIPAGVTKKLKWDRQKAGMVYNQRSENYENLDWTNQDFLEDVSEEHLMNTYPNQQAHWMKNFIQFTDAELHSFVFKDEKAIKDDEAETTAITPSLEEMKRKIEAFGSKVSKSDKDFAAKSVEKEGEEIREALEYVEQWYKRISPTKFEDDYEARLQSGQVISYQKYLDQTGGQSGKKLPENSVQSMWGKSGTTNIAIGMKKQEQREIGGEKKGGNDAPLLHKNDHLGLKHLDKFTTVKLDPLNRAVGKGNRKYAQATAYIYPGNGDIWVNGRHFSAHFKHYADRFNVTLPFVVTDTIHCLDAFVETTKGGHSGQAGAVRLAISTALASYQPEFVPILDNYEFLTWDSRRSERKKTQQIGCSQGQTMEKKMNCLLLQISSFFFFIVIITRYYHLLRSCFVLFVKKRLLCKKIKKWENIECKNKKKNKQANKHNQIDCNTMGDCQTYVLKINQQH
ncbi:30S ribosomal protein S9, partial [Reticulomyxa filosa]